MLVVDPSECDCRGGQCDPRSGECRCPDGMTGKQCDICSHKYSVPVEEQHNMHCEREQHTHRCDCNWMELEFVGKTMECVCICLCVAACDNCVIVLLEDLDKLEETLVSVSAQLSSLNGSSMAWTQLQSLNRTVEDVAVRARTHAVLFRSHTVTSFNSFSHDSRGR